MILKALAIITLAVMMGVTCWLIRIAQKYQDVLNEAERLRDEARELARPENMPRYCMRGDDVFLMCENSMKIKPGDKMERRQNHVN